MKYAALLLGFCAMTACSLDHVVVAELDTAGAGGTPAVVAGNANANARADGTAGEAATVAGSGGALGAAGAQAAGNPGSVVIGSGGTVDNTIIGTLITSGGGTTELRCSCVSRQAQVCGTDGLTYPRDCADSSACAPPEIACLQACPCLDGGVDGGSSIDFRWFPSDCVSSARCSEGVVCMEFSDVSFDNSQTTCVLGN